MPILLLLLIGTVAVAASRRAPPKPPVGGGGPGALPPAPAPKPTPAPGPSVPTGPSFVPFNPAPAGPTPTAPMPRPAPGGGASLAPATPATPRDPYGILGPLGPTPGIDALPEPQRTNVRHAVAYATDPAMLRDLAATLRKIGATDAAREVDRAADLVAAAIAAGAGQWPETQKLPEPYLTRARTLVVDGLDYTALFNLAAPFCRLLTITDYAALGPVPSYVSDPSAVAIQSVIDSGLAPTPEAARKYIYDKWVSEKFPGGVPTKRVPSPACPPHTSDLVAFLTALNAAGVIGSWTPEIGAAIARLKQERGEV